MELENIVLSKISHSERQIPYFLSYAESRSKNQKAQEHEKGNYWREPSAGGRGDKEQGRENIIKVHCMHVWIGQDKTHF
jgi:hypothetical protein